MMRRYWHPIGLSRDVESKPSLVKLLDEELVLFRMPDGRCGLLEARCPHRNANLVAGRVEGEGLRCAYHGWLFSPEGRCLEQPAEPATSKLKDRVAQKSYPVEELGGFVFAYLGPNPVPLVPRFDVLVDTDGVGRPGFARFVRANWLQLVDNHQDPMHTIHLHTQVEPWTGEQTCEHVKTDRGVMSLQVREGPRPGTRYLRETHYFAPNGLKVCLPSIEHDDFMAPATRRFAWVVPVDDYSSIEWEVIFAPHFADGRPSPFNYEADPSLYEIEPPRPYQQYICPGKSAQPRYAEGGAQGATVILRQDTLIQSSQGALQPREREHLGASDKGVAMLRAVVKECIDAVANGLDPIGVVRDPKENTRIVIESVDLIISDEELTRVRASGGLHAARGAEVPIAAR
jgi:5,5'-dehydrodivanillate O-demethylase